MIERLARPGAVTVLAVSSLLAQELRHIDTPLFTSACFDAVRGRVVAVGLSGYSHEWDGVRWRRAPDIGAPYGWCYCEAGTGRLFVFERDDLASRYRIKVRRGNRWQELPTTGGPSVGTTFVYDAGRNEVVAFGEVAAGGFTDNTWTFDGSTWTLRQPANVPSPRLYPIMAYDSVRQRVVLFGGKTFTSVFDDTWEWDGVDWSPVATANRPSPRSGSAMTYDSARQRMVLLGNTQPPGTSPGAGVADHWEYDGSNWLALPAPPAPIDGRLIYVTVYDEARGETLVLDSSDATARINDVWAWDGNTWSQRPGFGRSPWVRFGAVTTRSPSGTSLLSFGGQLFQLLVPGPSSDLWSYDGNSWSLASTGTVPARLYAVMWSQPSGTFVFGGTDATNPNLFGDTWRWDGVGWSAVTSPTSPSPRRNAAAAYMPTTNRAVLFGGTEPFVAFGDTWIFDGTAWQQAQPTVQPPARSSHAMAYDAGRDRVVMYGGVVGNGTPTGPMNATDTWEWDGTDWQQVITPVAPPSFGSMTYDADLQAMIYAAIPGEPLDGLQLWSYDGIEWKSIAVEGTTLGAGPALVAFEPFVLPGLNGRVAVVGGYGVRELIRLQARAATYGADCGVAAPTLGADSLPSLGNTSFTLEVTEAPANAPVVVIGADQPAVVPILGCTVLVDPNGVTALTLASPSGFASLPLPLPATPSLAGAPFYFQSAALSAAAPAGVAFSAGLRVVIGD